MNRAFKSCMTIAADVMIKLFWSQSKDQQELERGVRGKAYRVDVQVMRGGL